MSRTNRDLNLQTPQNSALESTAKDLQPAPSPRVNLVINTNTICAGLFEYSQFVEFQSRVAIIPDRFTRSFLKGLDICKLLPFRAGGAGEVLRFLPRK